MATAESCREGTDDHTNPYITPIPTEVDPANIGKKSLSKARPVGLKYIIKIVDYCGIRVGRHEYEELEMKELMRKNLRKFPKKALQDELLWSLICH